MGLFSVLSVQLGVRHVAQQLGHGRVHHVGEGLGVHAHGQHGDREQRHHQEFARIDVAQGTHVVVAGLAEVDALEHPEG
eukprot:11931-Eustigmatos_ZCMA.PRE.1